MVSYDFVYRGLKNVHLDKDDNRKYEFNVLASTTTDRDVVLQQFSSNGCLIKVNRNLVGLSMSELSAYPDESEIVLIPHQTYTYAGTTNPEGEGVPEHLFIPEVPFASLANSPVHFNGVNHSAIIGVFVCFPCFLAVFLFFDVVGILILLFYSLSFFVLTFCYYFIKSFIPFDCSLQLQRHLLYYQYLHPSQVINGENKAYLIKKITTKMIL